jgi:hypothetical protein
VGSRRLIRDEEPEASVEVVALRPHRPAAKQAVRVDRGHHRNPDVFDLRPELVVIVADAVRFFHRSPSLLDRWSVLVAIPERPCPETAAALLGTRSLARRLTRALS